MIKGLKERKEYIYRSLPYCKDGRGQVAISELRDALVFGKVMTGKGFGEAISSLEKDGMIRTADVKCVVTKKVISNWKKRCID